MTEDLTIGNAEAMCQEFARALEQSSEPVLDLAGVSMCDVAGLQLICAARRTAAQRGQRLRIKSVSPAVEEAAAEIGLPIEELGIDDL